jgi:hypothetical protein
VSTRTNLGLWTIASAIFFLWLGLLVTSGPEMMSMVEGIAVLFAACYLMPIVSTFFVYVTVGDRKITVPSGVFFRKSILINDISSLTYRPHGFGLLKGITIEYRDHAGVEKRALLPSISTFGNETTSQIIGELTRTNPTIRIDPRITAMLSR